MEKQTKQVALLTLFAIATNVLLAQNGKQAITSATTELKSYVDVVGSLVLAIGGVVGFVGGVRVYIKWNNGDQDVNKSLMGTRLDYTVNKNFTLGLTHMRLAEKPFTQKVNFNDDPVKNNIIGLDVNYATESKGLTRAFNSNGG